MAVPAPAGWAGVTVGRGAGPVLRRGDVRVVLLAAAASAVGRWVYNVGIAALVLAATESAAWLAALTVGRYVPALLLVPYAGTLAGRFRPPVMLIACDAVTALSVLAIVVGDGSAPLAVVVLLTGVASAATRTRAPVAASFLSGLVDERDLARANAATRSTESVGLVLGPALGALLVVHGATTAIAASAGAYALSGLAIAVLAARRRTVRRPAVEVAVPRPRDGLRALAASPGAALFLVVAATSSAGFGLDTVLLVVLADGPLEAGSVGYGQLLTGLGLGGVLGAFAVERLCRGPRLGLVAAGALLLTALPVGLLSRVGDPVLAALVLVPRGAGSVITEAVALTAVQRTARRAGLTPVLVVFHVVLLGALVLGAAAAAGLEALGGVSGLLVAAAVLPLVGLLLLPRLRAADRTGAQESLLLRGRVELLERLSVFDGARHLTLDRLAAEFVVVQPPGGTEIITQGAAADAFFVVVEGRLDVYVDEAGRDRRLLRTVAAPDFVGELGLLTHQPRSATVVTQGSTVLWRADGAQFLAALTDAPIAPALAEAVLTRLARTEDEAPDWIRAPAPDAEPGDRE